MTPLDRAADPFADLIEESFDEAAFLWRRWEHELTSPTRNLEEIWSWTEERLHGALDGVRGAGPRLVDIATSELRSKEIDRITVATALLATSTAPGAAEAIAAAINVSEGSALAAVMRGMELLGSQHALRVAIAALAANHPGGAGAICRLKAFRRVAAGDEMISAFRSSIPDAQVEAVRVARHTPGRTSEMLITEALASADPALRDAAVESGLGLGVRQAWDTATRIGRQLNTEAGPYLKVLAMLGGAPEHEIVFGALRVPELQKPAIWALGHIGTAHAAELCLAGMPHADLARASGEAYCWITGADLERDHLAVKEAPPEVPAFEDDDLDADLVPRPETLWPRPDADAARRHWAERRSQFAADVRHIHGRPVTGETRVSMVETGPMLRRPDLVLELRARTRGRYDVEPRAFARQQRRMMAAGRASLASHDGR